jgi:hypothetical protein
MDVAKKSDEGVTNYAMAAQFLRTGECRLKVAET